MEKERQKRERKKERKWPGHKISTELPSKEHFTQLSQVITGDFSRIYATPCWKGLSLISLHLPFPRLYPIGLVHLLMFLFILWLS